MTLFRRLSVIALTIALVETSGQLIAAATPSAAGCPCCCWSPTDPPAAAPVTAPRLKETRVVGVAVPFLTADEPAIVQRSVPSGGGVLSRDLSLLFANLRI